MKNYIFRWLSKIFKQTEPPEYRDDDANRLKNEAGNHIVVELKLPEAIVAEYYARQKEARGHQRITTWIAALTLIVVACYTVVSFFQWRTANRAASLTERAIDITDRAWLLGASAEASVGNDGVMTITATFHNAGKSPAFHVRHNMKPTDTLIPPVIPVPLGASTELTLPPGGKVTTAWRLESIPPEQVREIAAGRRPLFIWLAIKYSDPFTGDPNVKDRWSLECYAYAPRFKPLLICPGWQQHT